MIVLVYYQLGSYSQFCPPISRVSAEIWCSLGDQMIREIINKQNSLAQLYKPLNFGGQKKKKRYPHETKVGCGAGEEEGGTGASSLGICCNNTSAPFLLKL